MPIADRPGGGYPICGLHPRPARLCHGLQAAAAVLSLVATLLLGSANLTGSSLRLVGGALPAGWSAYTMWQYMSFGATVGDHDRFSGFPDSLRDFAAD